MKKFITISATGVAALGLGVLSAGTAFASTSGPLVITKVNTPNKLGQIAVTVNKLPPSGKVQFEELVGTNWIPVYTPGNDNGTNNPTSQTFYILYTKGATKVVAYIDGVSQPSSGTDFSAAVAIPSSTTSPGTGDHHHHHHHHHKSGDTSNLPGPNGDYFLLTHYSASPSGKANTYTLTVSVEQYQFDANDRTTNETHYFPNTVPVTWAGGSATATIDGTAAGINYQQGQTGNVSATQQYTLTFPKALTSSTELSIGPFYMTGPVQKNSPDDVVYDSPITLPYGQLPEVPFAVGIPVVGLGAAALILKRRALRA